MLICLKKNNRYREKYLGCELKLSIILTVFIQLVNLALAKK